MSEIIAQQTKKISHFIETIQTLYETEMGDFKRKTISYLNRLEDDLSDSSLKSFFHQFRESIICDDSKDIETLRHQVIHKIKKK
ncbi:MAG: hypothetical protein OXB86_02030, partial [Bdellovibrionales bacterium]|nr:hypothetical protein [Bdellovibrionales bacterium]